MLAHARHDTIVMVDSDMEVAPDHLMKVVAKLSVRGTGAVTCLYQGVGEGGLPATLAAMGINLHFLPNVVVGLTTGMAAPCFGATIAITREELKRIGGLKAFADHLWDDYAIGQAVRARGLKVAVCAFAPKHVCTETSIRSLFANQLRAARTIRGIDPAGHAGAVLTHPFPLALISVIATNAWWTWSLLVAAYSCRLVVARCVERRFGVPRTSYALVPVRDLLSFAIYIASYWSDTVEWRGETYRVDADGGLTPTAG
jgi:ceramide glucosyltransferase